LIPYVVDHYIDNVDLDEGKVYVDWEWDLGGESD
jgi:ribosomal 30S subunit maturation factor RimM